MKTISKKPLAKTAILALMTATLGFSAIGTTFAQDAAPSAPTAQSENQSTFRQHKQGPGPGGEMRGGDFLGFERGAEAVEIALVRLSHRIELTTEQQPLFDAFKTAAIAAATDFGTATESLRPTPPAEGETATAPDMAKRLDNAIAVQSARLAALEAIQPSATAFFGSLTDAQKVELTPQRPEHGGAPGFGDEGQRPGQMGHGKWGQQGPRHGGPGLPGAAPAPLEAPDAADAPPPANG